MPNAPTSLPRLVLSAALTGLFATDATADPLADFYKGKTMSIVVGHEVGTGFDTYARVLARHLPRHIPGQPNMIVQRMLGASGISAANWLYNVAPKDGTTLGAWVQTVPLDPLMGGTASKFDAVRFNWIGNLESSVATCVVTKASSIQTFADLQSRETLFGSTGGGGPQARHRTRDPSRAGVEPLKRAVGCPLPTAAIERFRSQGDGHDHVER